MEIQIVKRPPAPVMDGFDMRAFDVGGVYVVVQRLGAYLVDNGYAEPVVAPRVQRRTMWKRSGKPQRGR